MIFSSARLDFPRQFHLYNSRAQHNYINPAVQTTVKSNDAAQNDKKERIARLDYSDNEADVIMKIVASQYVTAFSEAH